MNKKGLMNTSCHSENNNTSPLPLSSKEREEVVGEFMSHTNSGEVKKKFAFTLAEVLITLSILGVVAAISIPNIIQQYQKRVTITKLKKAYSQINQMASNIAINSGCIGQTVKCSGLMDESYNDKFGSRDWVVKFKDLTGLKGDIKSIDAGTRLYCDKNNCNSKDLWLYYMIKLNDGLGYAIRKSQWNKGNTQEVPIGVYAITDTKDNAKLVMGKNVFLFLIYDNFQVEPGVFCLGCGSKMNPMSKAYNANDINTFCNPSYNNGNNGLNCAARIIRDGWKMNY